VIELASLLSAVTDQDMARMFADIDECRVGSFECEPNSVCRNLVGDYYCTCRMGYRLDDKRQRCVRDNDFIYNDLLQVPALEKPSSVQIDWRMSDRAQL